ncbi:alanine aminotransferase 2-like isoform X4 [Anabas testudineus]|uniref:alanine aminotransferase 2-like isoform X4 n=1 Tax=Anabas testudineus TaxID=64144 RepID=UPI000E45B612|nr:alanine aminotransferase 2-like isoform X4 [Anabas testudineus]
MSSLQHVNPRVRGIRVSPQSALQSLAARITQEITQGVQKSFKQVIDVSSGDPHKAGMKPVSFVRQVLSVCLYTQLLEDKSLPLDVKMRAQRLLDMCDGRSVGSYSAASGLTHIRQSVAEFISKRDAGVPSYSKEIFITSGSHRGITAIVKLMASGDGDTQTGVLAPMPCPHMLPNVLDEAGVKMVPYELTEERGWAVDVHKLHQALQAARGRCQPKAIYLSNPGNPTGHVQDRNSIEEVIRFAAAEKLILLVDEVYQDSVYGCDREFISYKKALFDMDKEFSQTVELISFHSLSNACMGDTPVTGQLALDLMINPPKPGDPSYDTYTQNAERACQFLNDLPGMSCQPAMGGIYLYPHLDLPSEFIENAEVLELEADVLYCQKLLEEEGVFVGAGCHHGVTTNNHHLRLCVLVPPDTMEEVLARLQSFHLRLMDTFGV